MGDEGALAVLVVDWLLLLLLGLWLMLLGLVLRGHDDMLTLGLLGWERAWMVGLLLDVSLLLLWYCGGGLRVARAIIDH